MAIIVVLLVVAAGALAVGALRPRPGPNRSSAAAPPPGGAHTTHVRDLGSGVAGHGGSSGMLSYDGARIRVWVDEQLVLDEPRSAVEVEWPSMVQGVKLRTASSSLHLLLDDSGPIENMVMTPGRRMRRDATRRRWRSLLG